MDIGAPRLTDTCGQYFQAWASAASAHDDERAVKRLKTRQRFVNLSEEKLSQKQQHCEFKISARLIPVIF